MEDRGNYEDRHTPEAWVVTNPAHGGKIDCHKCGRWIYDNEKCLEYDGNSGTFFHVECYNRYEHYYGLDKPID
jgi:hypothetical protein